jgi:hypothetical protein
VVAPNGVTECGYYENANQCRFQAGSCALPWLFKTQPKKIASSCPSGHTLINNPQAGIDHECRSDAMIDQDAAALAHGGVIHRDASGNVLSIEQPLGTVVSTAANYDQYGRPGLVSDGQGSVLLSWPANGAALPDTITVGNTAVNLSFQDAATLSGVSAGNASYGFAWWPNGSLFAIRERVGGAIAFTNTYSQDGKLLPNPVANSGHAGPVPVPVPRAHPVPAPTPTVAAASTFEIKAAPTFGSAAAVALPAVDQLGVHPITIRPPASATPIVIIGATIGAVTIYPFKEQLFETIAGFWRRCLAAEYNKECEDAAYSTYITEINKCDTLYPEKEAKWINCYALARIKLYSDLKACRVQ